MDQIHQVVFFNEFELDDTFADDDASSYSEVSSDAGSWVNDGTTGLEIDYCHIEDEDEEWKTSTFPGDRSELAHNIETDTLRVAPPCVQDVMPALVEETISAGGASTDDITEEHSSPSTPDAATEERVLETRILKTYRHNPYRYRVIPCRLTSMPVDIAASSTMVRHAPDNAYDTLPLCPCQSAAPSAGPRLEPAPMPTHLPSTARGKTMCCYFKQKGTCKMGNACWYGHDGDLYTPCHYGASCKAGHATLTQMEQLRAAPTFSQSATALASLSGLTVRVGNAAPKLPVNLHYQISF